MSHWGQNEEEEEDTFQVPKSLPSHTVYLIDASREMFVPDESGDWPFARSVMAVKMVLQKKMLSGDRDMLGIVLYNTKTALNANKAEGVYVLHDLDIPDVHSIQQLADLASHGGYKFGHDSRGSEFPLFEALWTCQTLFNTKKTDSYRELFLFTCTDNPNGGNKELRDSAMQRVRDLVDAGVEVTPYFVFPPSRQEPVDASLFWDKALPADPEDALFGSSSSSTSDGGATSAAATAAAAAASGSTARFRALTTIDDIVRDHVKLKEHKKRAMARLNLQIGGMEIAVQIYKMYQEAKKPSTIFINAVTNEPLKSSTEWLERTTGEAVDLDTQVKTYHPYGGVNVFFTKEEMRQIKGLAPQGLKLMGFKPLRLLRREHAIRGSSFVYPDDGATEGSHLPFAALHAEMLAMQVFAVCRMVARDSTAPRLVALVAQEEVRLPDGSSVHPYGMHLLELPFADDIRSLDGPVPDVTEPEIAAAAALSTKLSLNYSVHDFSNPTLTVVSGFIQSMALNAPIPEQFDNQLVPDSEGMERKRKYIDSFKSLLYPKAQPNALDAEWIDLYRATKLKKKTIPELKEYLKAHSLPGTGVKADLIERFRNLWELPE